MSQCPDAAYCEAHFKPLIKSCGLAPIFVDLLNLPSAIAPVMNVTMNFIATQSGDKFTCPHGARECDGNMAQVCAQALSPAKWSGLAPFASIYGSCLKDTTKAKYETLFPLSQVVLGLTLCFVSPTTHGESLRMPCAVRTRLDWISTPSMSA